MPYNNNDMNVYMKNRYHRRMKEAKEQLGGKCVVCGTTDDLEFDHIDPKTKLFSIGKKAASVSEKRFKEELDKCQLLCSFHHDEKHSEERSERMKIYNPMFKHRVRTGSYDGRARNF